MPFPPSFILCHAHPHLPPHRAHSQHHLCPRRTHPSRPSRCPHSPPLHLQEPARHSLRPSPPRTHRPFKFDVGAVTRRLFHPYTDDLAEQLVHACRLLQALRRRDVHDIDAGSHLFTALMLMLDNDGKNYAQLEWAGVHAYVGEFVKQKLWVGREANDGWPLDNQENACALWLMWLTIDRQRLLAESLREREEMVLRILPYVFLHHRYPASAAPPNHFHLPLSKQTPHTNPLAFPYPPPHRVHFRARTEFTPPLASIAAKLLYVVRREIRPIAVPPHLPLTRAPGIPGLTQEDYQELNRARAAVLPRSARWDWEEGRPRAVNLEEGEGDDGLEDGGGGGGGGGESRKWDTMWWRMRLCGDYRAPKPKFVPGAVFTPGCMRGMWKGKIYIPQGNLFNQLLHSPVYPSIPDARGNFSEASLGVIMQPVFLDVQEHHRVCLCAEFRFPWVGGGGPPPPPQQQQPQNPNVAPPQNVGGAHQNVGQHPQGVAQRQPQNGHPQQQLQNAPVPAPAHVQQQQNVHAAPAANDDLDDLDVEEDEEDDDPSATQRAGGTAVFDLPARTDNSMSNAWFPGRLGEVAFAPRRVGGPGAGSTRTRGEEGASASDGAGAGRDKTRERRDEVVFALDGERPDLWAEGACAAAGAGAGAGGGNHSATKPTANGNNANNNAYVYETYDPARVSAHDDWHQVPVHSADADLSPTTLASPPPPPPLSNNPACARCAGIERARRAERRRAEREARKEMARRVLDGALRAFGVEGDRRRRAGGDGDGIGDEEDMRMQDLDVRGFGLRLEGEEGDVDEDEDEEDNSEEDEEDEDAQIEVLGDDFPDGQPAFWMEEPPFDEHGTSEEEEQAQRREGGVRMDVDDPSSFAPAKPPSTSKPPKRSYIAATRREFDRARITTASCPSSNNNNSILLTGHTPASGLAWGQRYTTYGRVRGWDGLVGLLRVGRAPVNYIFIFGYVVGERTFVGEWRVAASDPLRPTWGSAFVMSRVGGEEEEEERARA
ncbi:hypothetical protein BDZ97DRAFT_1913764 [Flammula alnicola]|nr:hypothetical protein BDZ97DRAFT_1913764 [Flammula alnicola]